MKKFSDLTEREVLAVAIASEEEDGRIYMSFAKNLAERYPESARIFEQMGRRLTGTSLALFLANPPSSFGMRRSKHLNC